MKVKTVNYGLLYADYTVFSVYLFASKYTQWCEEWSLFDVFYNVNVVKFYAYKM